MFIFWVKVKYCKNNSVLSVLQGILITCELACVTEDLLNQTVLYSSWDEFIDINDNN